MDKLMGGACEFHLLTFPGSFLKPTFGNSTPQFSKVYEVDFLFENYPFLVSLLSLWFQSHKTQRELSFGELVQQLPTCLSIIFCFPEKVTMYILTSPQELGRRIQKVDSQLSRYTPTESAQRPGEH